ncbi:alpha/beta hydrolase [Candidatus Saccharibacteria bacterium]|nr:alpha/beta hydrolase [Candidatus Saccharibacteria bacterium]
MKLLKQIWHKNLKQPFRLVYTSYPGHKEPVVLLHGIASNKEFWQPLATLLSQQGHIVIVPDLLGHGGSPTPDYIRYSTGDQARSVVALLNKLNIKRYALVGHSMGALVASRVAAMRPEKVAKLVLFEPPLFADIPEFRSYQKRRQFYFDIYERIAQNPKRGLSMTKLVAKVSDNWTKYLVSDQAWLPIERSLRNTIMSQTSYEELSDTAIETDIVHGRFDVAVSSVGLKKMLAHNPNIRFHKTTERHNISKLSATFLANLILGDVNVKKRRNHASNLE